MCANCEKEGIGRRDFVKFAAAGAAALGLGGASPQVAAAEGAPAGLAPAEALAKLKAGNALYVSHPELCSANLAQSRGAVAGGQAPWATIISCRS
jgi:carbonic anhydrase